MIEIVYCLICSLDYINNSLFILIDLITIKNELHTALFLLSSTFLMIHYEILIPLAILGLALKMLSILYLHQKFEVQPPNTLKNIEFIK